MFFILSKILAVALEPLVHPYLLLILALICKWRRRRRTMRVLLVSAAIVPLLYGFLPLSSLPLRHLENQFPVQYEDPSLFEGVIVLGGHTANGNVAQSRGQPQQNAAAERLTYGLALHERTPNSILLFTGFSGKISPTGWSEPEITRRLLDLMNSKVSGVLFEETSRNTYENAVNSRKVLVPQAGSRWVIVTSAGHMPRAIGAFRAAGWSGLVPYPVDFVTESSNRGWFDLAHGHQMMRRAWHEMFGLVFYRMTGRSTALLPTPDDD